MMPNLGIAPSAIVLSPAARSYVIKQCHLAVLPSFSGTPTEGAVEFIMEYGHAVRSLPLGDLIETDLMLRCFPYVLKGKAKTWFLGLQPNSITTWQQLHDEFMLKFYQAAVKTYPGPCSAEFGAGFRTSEPGEITYPGPVSGESEPRLH